MDYYNNQDELYHYGRKGMKWGQNIFGKVKSGASRVGKKISDARQKKKEAKAAERLRKKPLSELTDAELKLRIERLKLEQSASQMMKNIDPNSGNASEGKKFISKFMSKSVGEAIIDASKSAFTEFAKKKLFKALGLTDEVSEEMKELKDEAEKWILKGKIAANKNLELTNKKNQEEWDKNHPTNKPQNKSKDETGNKPKAESKNESKDTDNPFKSATLDTPDKKIGPTVTKDGKTYSVNTGFNLKSKTRTSHEVTRLNKALEETYSEIRKQAEATEKENKEMAGAWAGAKKSYGSISSLMSERGFDSSSSPAEAIASVVSSPKKYSLTEAIAKRDARREAKSTTKTTNTSKNRYVNMVKAMKKSGRSAEYMAKRTGLSISEIYRLLDD